MFYRDSDIPGLGLRLRVTLTVKTFIVEISRHSPGFGVFHLIRVHEYPWRGAHASIKEPAWNADDTLEAARTEIQ